MSHPDRPQLPSLPGPYDDVEAVQLDDDGSVAQLADDESGLDEGSRAAEPDLAAHQRSAAAVPELPHTGDPAVDEALERLEAVQDQPPADQVETYVGAHRALQDRLADLEG